MKVYSRVTWDRDGTVLVEESYDYFGEVALCKSNGGGGSTTTVDKAYNSRMAAISERQLNMTEKYFDFWEQEQKGLDINKIAAQQKILPHQTTYDIAQLQAANELLPQQTGLAKEKMADMSQAIKQNAPVREKFLSEATKGVNVSDRMGLATADVAQSFKDASLQTQRGLSRMGVTPSAASTASTMNASNLSRAKANAGARGLSRIGAEDENFKRVQAGAQYGLSAASGGGNA